MKRVFKKLLDWLIIIAMFVGFFALMGVLIWFDKVRFVF